MLSNRMLLLYKQRSRNGQHTLIYLPKNMSSGYNMKKQLGAKNNSVEGLQHKLHLNLWIWKVMLLQKSVSRCRHVSRDYELRKQERDCLMESRCLWISRLKDLQLFPLLKRKDRKMLLYQRLLLRLSLLMSLKCKCEARELMLKVLRRTRKRIVECDQPHLHLLWVVKEKSRLDRDYLIFGGYQVQYQNRNCDQFQLLIFMKMKIMHEMIPMRYKLPNRDQGVEVLT